MFLTLSKALQLYTAGNLLPLTCIVMEMLFLVFSIKSKNYEECNKYGSDVPIIKNTSMKTITKDKQRT